MKIYLYFDFDERKEQKGITSPQIIEISFILRIINFEEQN